MDFTPCPLCKICLFTYVIVTICSYCIIALVFVWHTLWWFNPISVWTRIECKEFSCIALVYFMESFKVFVQQIKKQTIRKFICTAVLSHPLSCRVIFVCSFVHGNSYVRNYDSDGLWTASGLSQHHLGYVLVAKVFCTFTCYFV